MPLVHIAMRAGKPEAYRQAIFDSLYRAMREALNVPEDDQFMAITEHDAANFRYGHAYGVARSADVVYIQITVFSTRTPQSMPTFLVDGRVAGSWKYEKGKLKLEPFKKLDRAARRELDREADRLAELHME